MDKPNYTLTSYTILGNGVGKNCRIVAFYARNGECDDPELPEFIRIPHAGPVPGLTFDTIQAMFHDTTKLLNRPRK